MANFIQFRLSSLNIRLQGSLIMSPMSNCFRFPREYISKFDLLYPLEVVTDQSNLLGDQPWFHSSNRRLREVSAKASISRFKENRISEPSPKQPLSTSNLTLSKPFKK